MTHFRSCVYFFLGTTRQKQKGKRTKNEVLLTSKNKRKNKKKEKKKRSSEKNTGRVKILGNVAKSWEEYTFTLNLDESSLGVVQKNDAVAVAIHVQFACYGILLV